MNPIQGFISIDYDEGDQSSYRSINVTFGKRTKVFRSGNPVADWKVAAQFINQANIYPVLFSSSCDNFVMDGDAYMWIDDPNKGCSLVQYDCHTDWVRTPNGNASK